MYKIIAISQTSKTRVVMYIRLSYEQAYEICEGFNWQYIQYFNDYNQVWDLLIAEETE